MDVVISGIGGRFPRSANVAEFSDNLLCGKDLLEPAKRWPPGKIFIFHFKGSASCEGLQRREPKGPEKGRISTTSPFKLFVTDFMCFNYKLSLILMKYQSGEF